MDGMSALVTWSPESPLAPSATQSQLETGAPALTRHQIFQHLDLGLPRTGLQQRPQGSPE